MRFFLTSLLLLVHLSLYAQNTYTTVDQLDGPGQWLRTSLTLTPAAGDFVLLYQHGGATIALGGANTGAVSNLNGAGHYDLNRVARTSGDTVFLTLPVTNEYDLDATQLIVAPGTTDLTVTQAQSAVAYDGSTGGLLFLAAADTLTVGADLSAAAAGFRGGTGTEADSDCNRFTVADNETYNQGNWRGSSRGEGVAGVPTGQEFGRAFAGNGGGGGNDHNAGGGGGANTAGGGLGARNIVEGVFNNACRGNFPGRGGRALTATGDRVYFGGGGGAGHANNTDSANGGRGGGVVILWAPVVRFTGNASVSVNGESPATVDGDGGGGGGAAGSILIVADSLAGSPELSLDGGQGADVDNPGDRCFGPGGGGSGGRLLVAAFDRTTWSPTVSLARGGFGHRLNSGTCGADQEPAGPGSDGSEQAVLFPVPFGGFVQSADTLCASDQLLLTDASNGAEQVTWALLPESDALTLIPLGFSLRVAFADTAGGTFAAVQTLLLDGRSYPGDTAVFTVFPVATAAGADILSEDEFVSVTVDGATGFDVIRYDFGDGTVIDTTVTSLNYTYTSGGDYNVAVTLLNARCGDVALDSLTVSLAEFAFADADVKSAEGCAPLSLDVTDISTGSYAGSRWDLPGSETPVIFDELSPTVVYPEPGMYTGTLTLLGALGPDTVYQFFVTVNPVPTATFTVTSDTATAVFTTTTDIAEEFFWDFGDGQGTSTEQNPTYTYDSVGTFTVVLVATADPCSITIRQDVTIDVLSDVIEINRRGIKLFPNPTTGELRLTGEAELLDLFDLTGRYLGALGGRTADLSGLAPGTYVVRVKAGRKVYSLRVLVR